MPKYTIKFVVDVADKDKATELMIEAKLAITDYLDYDNEDLVTATIEGE